MPFRTLKHWYNETFVLNIANEGMFNSHGSTFGKGLILILGVSLSEKKIITQYTPQNSDLVLPVAA